MKKAILLVGLLAIAILLSGCNVMPAKGRKSILENKRARFK